jgi:hypothetical protein
MILKAEASIDIDQNRKVWIELSGKTEPDEDPTDVLPVLADSLVEALGSAYDHAAQRLGITPPGPDLRTFGED